MSLGSSNTQSTNWPRRLLWGLLTCIFVGPQLTQAQVLPEKNETEPTDELQRLPSDRKVSQHLQELGRLTRTGDEDKIRDALKLLCAAEPSLMVPDGSRLFRPLHRDLIERIQSFPEQLQADLLNEPGATPQLLQNLYQDNGPSGLITFLHRHAGSRESFKAYLMLAAIHRDRGHWRATLYWLDPVLHSTAPADLRESAIAMRDEVNAAAIITTSAAATDDRSGDEESSRDSDGASNSDSNSDSNSGSNSDCASDCASDEDVSDPEPAAAQEADDTASGAKPPEAATDQNADADADATTTNTAAQAADETSANSAAISTLIKSGSAWQQKLYLNSVERHASQDLVRLLAADGDKQAIAWIAGEPVVDAKAVYVRSSGGLLAYDRITGKVLWTRPLDRQISRRAVSGRIQFPIGDERSIDDIDRLQNSREIISLHRDAIQACMTSDTTTLFAICDSGEPGAAIPDYNQPFGMLSRRSDLASHPPQELVAIEKETGRRLWSAGGAPLEKRFGNELSRAWFAGAPTVSGSLLYGIIEQDDAHWLVCLRSETGEVVWKLILAYPEVNIFQDTVRQLSSSRPIVEDGLIWVNTTDGWLMAIDALTHSVIWSRGMTTKTPDASQRQMFRRGMIQTQQLGSISDTWRPASMQLLQDGLLVAGDGNHQLLLINPLTGAIPRRVTRNGANVVIAADEESIIVAGPKEIQRLSFNRFKVIWKTELKTPNVVAVGPGARLGENLLVPLSDGSIQILRYANGKLAENFPAVRPTYSAGGLLSLPDGLLSYGLDHICVYSMNGNATKIQTEPLEQARFLFETGKFAEAEQILTEYQPAVEHIDVVNQLLFRIAAIRTLKEADQQNVHLKTAAKYASTTQDRAVVVFLTLETRPDISSDQIIEFLELPQTVLNVELPQLEQLREMLFRPTVNNVKLIPDISLKPSARVTRPLRHQLLQILQQHLSNTAASDFPSWTSSLQKISDTDVLSIEQASEAVRDELLRRADVAVNADKLTETTWHLLLQARRSEDKRRLTAAGSDDATSAALSQSAREFDERHRTLVDRFINQLTMAASQKEQSLRPHPAAVNLLAIVKSELFPDAADELPASPQEVLAKQWAEWQDQTYSAIPVNSLQGGMMPQSNEAKLSLRYQDDRFLSGWRWSTFRENSVLAVRSLLNPDEPMCTIDGGMFDALSLGNAGSVMRFGSVVLVQNSMGLSAVSMIDQRVLWSRRIPNQSSRAMWQLMAEMHLFNRFFNSLPAWIEVYGRDLRITGGNNRWVCVQTPTSVEMIDLLTGQNLWSLQNPPEDHRIFATDSCVFVSRTLARSSIGDQQSLTCLRQADGAERDSAISQNGIHGAIRATGNELVIWHDSVRSDSSVFLNWTNAETGEIRHSVELQDMLKCQFIDVRTLAAVTRKGEFEIIDLVTADKKILQLAADKENEAIPAMKPGSYSRASIIADSANYYVFPLPGRQGGQIQLMLGSTTDLRPIAGELRAIDRVTGKTRWVLKTEENSNGMFDVTGDPVLLLVHFSTRKNPANVPGGLAIPGLAIQNQNQTVVTAYSRIGGAKLFQHTVLSRFPTSNLDFKVTPQKHLDLQAFGSRMRFVPDASLSP